MDPDNPSDGKEEDACLSLLHLTCFDACLRLRTVFQMACCSLVYPPSGLTSFLWYKDLSLKAIRHYIVFATPIVRAFMES